MGRSMFRDPTFFVFFGKWTLAKLLVLEASVAREIPAVRGVPRSTRYCSPLQGDQLPRRSYLVRFCLTQTKIGDTNFSTNIQEACFKGAR